MLERGYEEGDNYEINIASDPLMDRLRNDGRFQALCRRVMQGSDIDWSVALAPASPLVRR